MAIKRVRVNVSGRVQGVFFRASASDMARRQGLLGWVKNNHDGSVEALFQGEEHILERAIMWCHEGPPSAMVTDVKISYETVSDNFNDFKVTY